MMTGSHVVLGHLATVGITGKEGTTWSWRDKIIQLGLQTVQQLPEEIGGLHVAACCAGRREECFHSFSHIHSFTTSPATHCARHVDTWLLRREHLGRWCRLEVL